MKCRFFIAASFFCFSFFSLTFPLAAQVLRMATATMPRGIDPRFYDDTASRDLESLLHCRLVEFSAEGTLTASLAKDWRWVSPTLLEVGIKKGAFFRDGTPVSTSDIKASFDFFQKDSAAAFPKIHAFPQLASVKIQGDKVLFELRWPDSSFLQYLDVAILPAKSPALIETPEELIGCGPFRLEQISTNAITLTVNQHYFLGAKPSLQGVTFHVIKDEAERLATLMQGKIDAVQNGLAREAVIRLIRNPSFKVYRRPGLHTAYLGFQTADPLLARTDVRRALALALNRDAAIKFGLSGFAVLAKSLLLPTDPFLNKELPSLSFDPAAAQKLLDAAGFKDPDGKGPKPRFTLNLRTTTQLSRLITAKSLAGDLQRVGIEVVVEPLEPTRFEAMAAAGKVQLWLSCWDDFKDPDIYRTAFASHQIPPAGRNWGRYRNSALDNLVEKAQQVTQGPERKKLYDEVQQILATELPGVFLWHEEMLAVTSTRVQNFTLFAGGGYGGLAAASLK